MKKIGTTIAGLFLSVMFIGLAIHIGSAVPPADALVYLNPPQTTYFPPTRTPANSGYIAVSYADAKRRGAKPDNVQGFSLNGPPLLISILQSVGIFSEWPWYWEGTNTKVEKFR